MPSTQYDIRNTQYEIRDTLHASRDTLHASRNSALQLSGELYKSTLFLQNEPNFKIVQIDISTCYTSGYGNYLAFHRLKNKAKQSQFKPNFEPKLASFFKELALIRKEIYAFVKILNQRESAKSEIKILYLPITAMPSLSAIFGICSLKFE